MNLLKLATLFHLRVVNKLPLAFIASGMLPSASIHDASHCDASVVIS